MYIQGVVTFIGRFYATALMSTDVNTLRCRHTVTWLITGFSMEEDVVNAQEHDIVYQRNAEKIVLFKRNHYYNQKWFPSNYTLSFEISVNQNSRKFPYFNLPYMPKLTNMCNGFARVRGRIILRGRNLGQDFPECQFLSKSVPLLSFGLLCLVPR